jgi:hypothetical protein
VPLASRSIRWPTSTARGAPSSSSTRSGSETPGESNWIILTKDDAIRRRPAERDALTEAAVRVFCLTNRNMRGAEQTERFVSNRHRILRQARKPGPYIYGVYEKGLVRLWP